jgi:hypothetical protein
MAVLMPDSAEASMSEIRSTLRRRLDTLPLSVDLVMTTEEFASRFRDEVNSIYYRILRDGQVAYEQRAVHTG